MDASVFATREIQAVDEKEHATVCVSVLNANAISLKIDINRIFWECLKRKKMHRSQEEKLFHVMKNLLHDTNTLAHTNAGIILPANYFAWVTYAKYH